VSFFRGPLSRSFTPQGASILSVSALTISIAAAVAAHLILYVPLGTTLLYAGVATYLTFALSWSYLDKDTWRVTVRCHNAFVVLAVGVFAAALVTGEDRSAFPRWGTFLILTSGVLTYSAAGFCAVRNLRRWRRGQLRTRLH